jgi:tetratricopeptide (TPR) repeat protein
MKRVALIFLSALFVLFVAITFLKSRSSDTSAENGASEKTLAEKEKILSFWELYRQATAHRHAGRWQEAAADYQKALALNDRHEDALYYLGNIHLELGEFDGAEKAWKRLVQVNPHSARAHFQLGDLYLSLEREKPPDIEAARIEYRRALEINKEETGPVLRLGQIALIQGNLTEAQNYFDAVIGSNFKSVEAHFLNGYTAWKKGDSQKALNLLSHAAKHSQSEKPVQGVPGEGDTKTGQALGMSARQTLFQAHFQGLPELDEAGLSQQMEAKYQALDAFLEEIRKKMKT